jgi:hypothetical protein
MRGWLPASEQQKNNTKRHWDKAPFKYFTFCASQAIDVFMLERYGVLRRLASGRLEGVYFCERDLDAFGEIARLIGSPEQGFLGDFEDIVLFEDDDETRGKDLYIQVEEKLDENIRKRLRTKDTHKRLQQAFPFDIINLDVCGVMFPPRRSMVSPLLRAILKILEWQTQARFPDGKPCKQFTLFLTSHIDPALVNTEVVDQLCQVIADNLGYSSFRQSFSDRFGHEDPNALRTQSFVQFYCLGVPKYLIDKAITDLGWFARFTKTFVYARPDIYEQGKKYHMMHTVAEFVRYPEPQPQLHNPRRKHYFQAVTDLVQLPIEDVDVALSNIPITATTEEDLNSIVTFRDSRRPKPPGSPIPNSPPLTA